MGKSKVYWTDFRTTIGTSLTTKLQKMIMAAGFDKINMEKKFVAIKMHFGELGNLAFLRPNYAKAVADLVKKKGGVPFLTDCNTLYPGSRKNALEHLDCANINGFNPISTGCQILIADGLKGNDDVEVEVKGGEYCKTALIGRSVMDADVFISLTHFKCHEDAGVGGTIKNIGMGCGSRAGKMIMHDGGTPAIDASKCRNCKKCANECGSDAISYETGKAKIDETKCKGCGRCIASCAFDAIYNKNTNAGKLLNAKMVEYTKAVCDGRDCFHISLVMDISPFCDCHGENDAPILPDVGMFCSFDPVALDKACIDMCKALEPIRDSRLGDNLHKEGFKSANDHFIDNQPKTDYSDQISHGEKIGLGSSDYELIKV